MKKFIIAMLCVAVLFGFAACDNSSNAPSGSEGLDKLVVSMKVEAKTGFDGKYFDGEKIDLSNYVITATTYNGDEVEVAAADVSLDKDKVSAGDNEDVKSTLLATLTYKGATYGAIPVKAEITGYVYDLSAVDVKINTEKTYYVGDDIDSIKDNITVTGYALKKDGTQVYSAELADDAYDLTVAKSANDKFNSTGSVEFTVTGLNAIKDGKNGGSVVVDNDTVKSIEVVAGGEGKVEAVVGATVGDAADYVTITYTMNSGRTLVDDEFTGTATIAWEKSDTKFLDTETARTVKVTVGEIEATREVPVVKNYIKSFTVNKVEELYLMPGDDITKKITSVEATWAVTYDNDEDKPVQDKDLLQYLKFAGTTEIPDDYTMGSLVPVTITIDTTNVSQAAKAECKTKIYVNYLKTLSVGGELAKNSAVWATNLTAITSTFSEGWANDANKPSVTDEIKASLRFKENAAATDLYQYVGTDTDGNVYLSNSIDEGNVAVAEGDGVVKVESTSVADIVCVLVGEYSAAEVTDTITVASN